MKNERVLSTAFPLQTSHTVAPPVKTRAVRDKTAAHILGISRSHFWDRQNPNSRNFDETMPKRFKLGAGPHSPTVWFEHELLRWLEDRAAASPWRK